MWVFDNSNINESYSGVTTPATYSFARRVYKHVYIQFCILCGVSKSEIENNSEIFEQMVFLIGGRMYYNLNNWHSLIKMLPGYKQNSVFMEEMMGIDKKYQGKIGADNLSPAFSVSTTLKLIYIAGKILTLFLLMPYLIHQFNKKFDAKNKMIRNSIKNALKNNLPVEEIMRLYQGWESDLTRDFSVPIVNDLAVMVSTGILKKMLGNEANKYVSGLPGIKSAIPGQKIAEIVRESKGKSSFLKSLKYNNLVNDYILNFGYRVPGELKLESLSFQDNPSLLKNIIQNNLHLFGDEIKSTPQVNNKLSLKEKIIVSWVQRSISYREETRLKRAMAFSIVRDLLLGIGKKLKSENKINSPSDIFWLSLEELENFRKIKNIGTLIVKRLNEFSGYEKLHLPKRIESPEVELNLSKIVLAKGNKPKGKKSLPGSVASFGKDEKLIVGEALVLNKFDMKGNYKNKILVVAQTDPGWTIIFPLVKAIVVERGGMLSHAAIVSREMKIACLTGVVGATVAFKTGDILRVDLLKGKVSLNVQ